MRGYMFYGVRECPVVYNVFYNRQTLSVFALGLDLGLTWIFQVKYETRHQCEQG